MRAISWGRTDTGLAREHNEDSFLINRELGLFLVADGMGGHAGGEIASRLTVEAVERGVLGAQGRIREAATRGEVAEALEGAVQGACKQVYERSLSDPRLFGMGTTLSGLLLVGRSAWVAHVGDSRVYLLRKGGIRRLTEDHSLVQEQIRAGILTPDEARHSNLRNIITRSVGFEASVPVDILQEEMRGGDTFLLCSDGLSNLVEDEEIAWIAQTMPGEALAEALIQLANERGGDDNITAVVVHIAPES